MDLVQFEKNLRSVDVWEILIPIIQKNLHHVERLNKEQLKKGIRSTGASLPAHSKSPMSEIYVDSKIDRGVYDESIYPSWNLYNTGSFYNKIKAEIELSTGISIESTDFKATGLEDAIGSDMYGLTQESLKQFCALLIDEFREDLLKEMSKSN
jgi:hypothetical protein